MECTHDGCATKGPFGVGATDLRTVKPNCWQAMPFTPPSNSSWKPGACMRDLPIAWISWYCNALTCQETFWLNSYDDIPVVSDIKHLAYSQL